MALWYASVSVFWNVCTTVSSSSGVFMITLAGSKSFRICLYLDQFVFAVILLAKFILCGLMSNSEYWVLI